MFSQLWHLELMEYANEATMNKLSWKEDINMWLVSNFSRNHSADKHRIQKIHSYFLQEVILKLLARSPLSFDN